ncbi:hypothetical protein, partial [Metallibacterium scheffleri]|uniref:hypothetical protein n=1 Tax=Metallibacterium scheffleri TaxID=993689 RepID=UPI0026F06D5D
TTGLSLGSDLALSLGKQGAQASIAAGADVASSGNVVVDAATTDPGLHNVATSDVSSTAPGNGSSGGSSNYGVSLAVALGWQAHDAQAFIGSGASVSAARVAVGAQNDLPLSFLKPYLEAWQLAQQVISSSEWSTLDQAQQDAVQAFVSLMNGNNLMQAGSAALGQVASNVGSSSIDSIWSDPQSLLSGVGGVLQNIAPQAQGALDAISTLHDQYTQAQSLYGEIKDGLGPNGMTSFARAQGDASKLSLAGAIDYLSLADTTQAWIAPGATVTLDAALGAGQQAWSSDVGGGSSDWSAPLTVQAQHSAIVLAGAGNGFFSPFGVSSSGGSNSTGVGGAFDWTDFANTTQAWVADGATLQSRSNDIAVQAEDAARTFGYVPSGGKGSGYAGNGAVAFTRISDQTLAAVDRAATIDAGSGAVSIDALGNLESFSLAGALVSAQAAGFGVGVAVDMVDPSTTAEIADTSTLSSAVGDTSGNAADCTSSTCLSAGSLQVLAQTQGAVGTLAVAGATSSGSSSGGSGG